MAAVRIRDEIKQRKPFHSLSQEAVLALVRTADLLRRHFSDTLEPHGITPQQFNVLRILRGAGKVGLPTMEIGRRMIEQTPGTTRLVDRLIDKGWVTRESSAGDRRQVVCRITSKGLTALAATDAPMRAADEKALEGLSKEDLRSLLRILDIARSTLRGDKASLV